jgi:hypothetical protein
MEQVPCPNSSEINGNRRNNWMSRICLGVTPPFLSFGPCIMCSPLVLRLGGTCTSLDPLQSVAIALLEFEFCLD